MPRAFTIAGLVAAILVALLFAADLIVGIPFGARPGGKMMDAGFLVVALILGYLSWSTFRQQG